MSILRSTVLCKESLPTDQAVIAQRDLDLARPVRTNWPSANYCANALLRSASDAVM